MQTLHETLVEVEAKALVDTLFETSQETLTQVRSKRSSTDCLREYLSEGVEKW